MLRNKKGFTLIEMLAVIAIIAVLISVIIPTVFASSDKAKAAADAANLRSVLGQMNSVLATGETVGETATNLSFVPPCKTYPEAKMYILYDHRGGFIEVYYVQGSAYYGLDYFAELSTVGSTNIGTDKPSTVGEWYEAGVGVAPTEP